MTRTIDLSRTVFELCEQYPEVRQIMADAGFGEVTKNAMLHSVGKLMTIPKGARMKGIDLATVVAAFEAAGFQVVGAVGGGQNEAEVAPAKSSASKMPGDATTRTNQLKALLRRLGDGEDLEAVRADFARDFAQVEASEIMAAEQELMDEGTPLEEVQRLCDVHSALFHGATAQEMLANVEQALAASQDVSGTGPSGQAAASGLNVSAANAAPAATVASEAGAAGAPGQAATPEANAAALQKISGHPLQTLTRENEALVVLVDQVRAALAQNQDVTEPLARVREVSIHYAKKGDLLYPLLKVRYGISGPSNVMWTVDDEIRDELAVLAGMPVSERNNTWHERLEAVLTRVEEMTYKEQNILFPLCAQHFSAKEWQGIYHDAKDYASCLGVKGEAWNEAEEAAGPRAATAVAGEVAMPGGTLTLPQLTALLNTIPLEITFVDAQDINRFFNEGPKVFKRPGMALGRDVYSCHPPKVEPMVRGIIQSFRAGERDEVSVWMDKGGRSMLVRYLAVRDNTGVYLGTVELVQDMEFAREHFEA